MRMRGANIKSSGLAERPTSAASDALLCPGAPMAAILADLEGLGVEGLRRQWRKAISASSMDERHAPLNALLERIKKRLFGDEKRDKEALEAEWKKMQDLAVELVGGDKADGSGSESRE